MVQAVVCLNHKSFTTLYRLGAQQPGPGTELCKSMHVLTCVQNTYAHVQIFSYAHVQLFSYAHVQIFTYAHVQIFSYAHAGFPPAPRCNCG